MSPGRALVLLALLTACRHPAATPCDDSAREPVTEAWDPAMTDEVRVDESTAAWSADGAAVVDAASKVDCPAAAPCVEVVGDGAAVLDTVLNRGVANHLAGEVWSSGGVRLQVVQVAVTGEETNILAAEYAAGTATIDSDFTLDSDGTDVRILFTPIDGGTARVDSFALTAPTWDTVAATPADTLRFGFLIHVEDDARFVTDEATWTRRARVLAGLSATLAAHGAMLDIQAASSFIRGAALWDPTWIPARVAEGAAFSIHIHPADDGSDLERVVREGKTALADQGIAVTDLNGGFGLGEWALIASAGMRSISAFKDATTQLGLNRAYVQPWRPGEGTSSADQDLFGTNDPDGPLLYVPGAPLHEVDHPRFPAFAARVLSQALAHTRAGFVNTWYYVLHVDSFGPTDDADAMETWLDDGSLEEALAYYGQFLTETTDPLAADGTLVYDTPAGMEAAWTDWDASCSAQ